MVRYSGGSWASLSCQLKGAQVSVDLSIAAKGNTSVGLLEVSQFAVIEISLKPPRRLVANTPPSELGRR